MGWGWVNGSDAPRGPVHYYGPTITPGSITTVVVWWCIQHTYHPEATGGDEELLRRCCCLDPTRSAAAARLDPRLRMPPVMASWVDWIGQSINVHLDRGLSRSCANDFGSACTTLFRATTAKRGVEIDPQFEMGALIVAASETRGPQSVNQSIDRCVGRSNSNSNHTRAFKHPFRAAGGGSAKKRRRRSRSRHQRHFSSTRTMTAPDTHFLVPSPQFQRAWPNRARTGPCLGGDAIRCGAGGRPISGLLDRSTVFVPNITLSYYSRSSAACRSGVAVGVQTHLHSTRGPLLSIRSIEARRIQAAFWP